MKILTDFEKIEILTKALAYYAEGNHVAEILRGSDHNTGTSLYPETQVASEALTKILESDKLFVVKSNNSKFHNLWIGLTLKEATATFPYYIIRVVEQDGVPMVCTRDVKFNRINVAVKNAVIIRVDGGG